MSNSGGRDSTLPSTYCWKSGNKERNNSFLLPNSIRGILAGKSGCGKTTLLTYLLLEEGMLDYNHLVLCARSLHQDEYQALISGFDCGLSKAQVRMLFHLQQQVESEGGLKETLSTSEGPRDGGITIKVHDTVETLPDPSEVDTQKRNLFVFDDVLMSRQGPIEKYYCRGRHNNVDSLYITQNYHKLPRQTTRENSNVFFLFPQDFRSLNCIFYDLCAADNIPWETFKEFCVQVWKKPYNFVTIDTTREANLGKYRRNLSDFWSPILNGVSDT